MNSPGNRGDAVFASAFSGAVLTGVSLAATMAVSTQAASDGGEMLANAFLLFMAAFAISIFITIPSATLLVMPMASFMRSQRWAERYWAWGLAGMIAGMPAALFGAYFFTLGRFLHQPTFTVLMGISLVCGLIARRRYQPGTVQRNP